jgi:predicted DsbA family dithiol-disulfide isomerase
MLIDLFADIACPWCWIGERRLRRALEARGVDATVRWRPFQLNPGLPPEGEPWRAFVDRKFGGWQRARPMFETVARAGADDGVRYEFERVPVAPNTRDAHRLVLLAGAEGKTFEMADALFAAYFSEGRNVGDRAVLLDAAASVGLDPAEVERMLDGARFDEDVDESQRIAQRSGITGVPFAVFAERYGVSGAQPPEVFETALDRALGEAEAA